MIATGLFAAAPTRFGFSAWLRRPLGRAALALLLPLALLLVWAASARWGRLPQQILPSPLEVWQSFADLARSGELLHHTTVSLLRVVYGFAAGAAAGLLLGIATGLSPTVEDYVKPLFTALAQVPTLGWIPLLMLLVGIDETLKIVIIAKAAFVPITINTAAGMRTVPRGLVEVAESFRFSRFQLLRKVAFPAAVPQIFTGIRYGLTHAWMALVGVELLASSEGLGYLLVWSRQMFWLDQMIVGMLVIGLVGFLMDAILGLAEARLQRWRVAGL